MSDEQGTISIANHPRARAGIRRTRARVGIGAFVLVLAIGVRAGVPGPDVVLRALIAGVAGLLVAWAAGVVLWKQLLMAELRAAATQRQERRRALLEAAAERRAS